LPKKAKWLASGFPRWLAAFLAGAALNLAFAPYRQPWVAPLALGILYALLKTTPARPAFGRGFAFGAGLFAFGVPWVYLTLARFGGMPAPLAALACALFIAILASYAGLACAAFARLHGRDALDPWLFAAIWVLGEWVRGVFLTGFPWLDVGYAASLPPLTAWAPLVGVLGLSFLLTASGALAVDALRGRRRSLLPVLLMMGVTPALAGLSFVHRVGAPITASLVQGDVLPTVKWHPGTLRMIVRRYLRLTAKSDGRLVVWPETAIPAYSHQLRRRFIPYMQRLARVGGRHFLFGLIEGNANDPNGPIYNAVMSIGRHDGFYRKRHLVPFGEYLPWPALLNPVLDILHIPMASFTPWHGAEAPLPVAHARVGVTICYEVAYGPLVTQGLPGATLLVNASDDSWYGHSNEAAQQFQIAQMRAAEAGRDMMIATNDGITALVGHTGQIRARLAPFREGVLTVVAQPYAGLTPYDRFGNTGVLAVLSLIVAAAGWRRYRARSVSSG
jgi:apolipoprotein N-acyltransferase